ncbi:MAG: hypothetical protein GC134_00565 [Proteobacteria bacterium]|nr:hypothetical protein [Pseudomonadota bacterium]
MLDLLNKYAYGVAAFMVALCTLLGLRDTLFGTGAAGLYIMMAIGTVWCFGLIGLSWKERALNTFRVGMWGFVAMLWITVSADNGYTALLNGDTAGMAKEALMWLAGSGGLFFLCHMGLRKKALG